jgi:hypothetical protein
MGAGATPHTGPLAATIALFGGEHPNIAAWSLRNPLTRRYDRMYLGAATLVLNGFAANLGGPGLGQALTEFGTLRVGHWLDCWRLRDTDEIFRLPREWVQVIQDGKGVAPTGTIEAKVYSDVVILANYTSAKAFSRAARTDITLTHLLEQPNQYRGEVVRVQGQLQKINRYKPPFEADRAGVGDLYEAWISIGRDIYCFVFTQWPAGLSRDLLGKPKLDNGPVVRAEGYFFKLFKGFRYQIKKRNVETDVPFLIGHSLQPVRHEDASAGEGTGWIKSMILGMLGLLVAAIFGVIGLTYWYRRSDNNIRRRLLQARSPEFILPPPDATPVAPLAAPVGRAVGPATPPPRLNLPADRAHRPVDRSGGEGGADSPDRPPDEGAGS